MNSPVLLTKEARNSQEFQKKEEDMTIEELKEYYDAGGRQRLSALDEKGKRDLFKRFTVSLINQNLI